MVFFNFILRLNVLSLEVVLRRVIVLLFVFFWDDAEVGNWFGWFFGVFLFLFELFWVFDILV